jgi:hypothetical protein
MTNLASSTPPKADAASKTCSAGSSCDCSSEPKPARHLSWPATLALTAVGTALCLLIVKLFGA